MKSVMVEALVSMKQVLFDVLNSVKPLLLEGLKSMKNVLGPRNEINEKHTDRRNEFN